MKKSDVFFSPQAHVLFWAGILGLFIGFVWIFSSVLTPFVLGIAIAYLLNPVVQALIKFKIPRLVATLIILISFFAFVLALVIFAGPPLAREAANLAESIPGYADQLIEWAKPYLVMAQERFGTDYIESTKKLLQDNAGKLVSISSGLASGIASSGQAFVGFFTTLVLTPLVAFFMMQEWPRVTAWVDDLIPRSREKTIKNIFEKMNSKVAGFIRGQLTVAFILGAIYAIALSIAGLNYGFLIGIIAGVLSIIPLVGSTIGLVVSLVVAWFQAGTLDYVAIIAAIFIVGQLLEGNVLSPKVIGDSVGLHPLWVLFSLMAGGSLFGLLGMLLAVPVTAVIGVLLGFGIQEYKESAFYKKADSTKPKKSIAKKTTAKKTTKKASQKAIKKTAKKKTNKKQATSK